MNSELCMFCLFMFISTGAKQGEGVENCAVCFVEVLLYNLLSARDFKLISIPHSIILLTQDRDYDDSCQK